MDKSSGTLFKSMTYFEKKEKINTLLVNLKVEGNIYDDLYSLINFIDDVSEKLLVVIYEIIIKSINKLEQEETNQSHEKFESLKNIISKIRLEKELEEDQKLEEILSKLL